MMFEESNKPFKTTRQCKVHTDASLSRRRIGFTMQLDCSNPASAVDSVSVGFTLFALLARI